MTDVLALRAIAQELVDAGVTDVIACPGSRSTPLALARPRASRVARPRPARRALGRLLRARPRPGVAAAGRDRRHVRHGRRRTAARRRRGVARARPARPPDRRPAARAARPRGAADDRPGRHLRPARPLVRWTCRSSTERRRRGATFARSSAGRWRRREAVRPGPVHLNIGFREPLIPSDGARAARRPGEDGPVGPVTTVVGGRPSSTPTTVRDLAARLAATERGLIVAGPQDDPALPAALARLAAATGFPIVADPLSGVRCGPHDRSFVLDPRRPPRPARAVARRPPAGSRRPVRRDADLEADADVARRARRPPRSSSTPTAAGATRRSSRPRSSRPTRPPPRTRSPTTTLAGPRSGGRGRAPGARPTGPPTTALAAWLDGVEARGEAFEGLPFAVLGGAPARWRAPVGRQQHAGPRHGRLAARQRPRHPAALEPRRERHRRRRVDRPRRGRGGRRSRSPSSSATCRSCTT